MKTPYAADRILDAFEAFDLKPVAPDQVINGSGILAKAMQVAGRFLPKRGPTKPDERSLQKFRGVSEEEITAPLAQWADGCILPQMPQVTRFNDRLWVLH